MMNLFVFAFCAALVVVAQAGNKGENQDVCYKEVNAACDLNAKNAKDAENCNARYGDMHLADKNGESSTKDTGTSVEAELQGYANTFLRSSYDYLLVSSHFKNYEASRDGFQKFFRGLSDEKWEATKDLVSYITKRGGEMNFKMEKSPSTYTKTEYEDYELQSLARALDMEKKLAKKAFDIHRMAARRTDTFHDAELSQYIEERFAEKQSGTIRELAGYVTDLRNILTGSSSSLGVHLFDQYLGKQ